jgi:hypothetical protein
LQHRETLRLLTSARSTSPTACISPPASLRHFFLAFSEFSFPFSLAIFTRPIYRLYPSPVCSLSSSPSLGAASQAPSCAGGFENFAIAIDLIVSPQPSSLIPSVYLPSLGKSLLRWFICEWSGCLPPPPYKARERVKGPRQMLGGPVDLSHVKFSAICVL